MLTPSFPLCRSGPWWLTFPLFSPSCCFVESMPVLACRPPSCTCLTSSRFAPCPGQSLCLPPACRLLLCALHTFLSQPRDPVCALALCVFLPEVVAQEVGADMCGNVSLWTFRVGKAGICSPSQRKPHAVWEAFGSPDWDSLQTGPPEICPKWSFRMVVPEVQPLY